MRGIVLSVLLLFSVSMFAAEGPVSSDDGFRINMEQSVSSIVIQAVVPLQERSIGLAGGQAQSYNQTKEWSFCPPIVALALPYEVGWQEKLGV